MVTVLLFSVTVIVFGWAIFLLAFGVNVIEMLHMAAPSTPAYDKMLGDVCRDAQTLLYLTVTPMAAMTLLWLFAFLRERRKSQNLITKTE